MTIGALLAVLAIFLIVRNRLFALIVLAGLVYAAVMAVQRLARRALEVIVEFYGPMDPHTNGSRTRLAFLLCWHGRIIEAETLFRQVLQVTERLLVRNTTTRAPR
jgi:tetratricopeptide repeat protein